MSKNKCIKALDQDTCHSPKAIVYQMTLNGGYELSIYEDKSFLLLYKNRPCNSLINQKAVQALVNALYERLCKQTPPLHELRFIYNNTVLFTCPRYEHNFTIGSFVVIFESKYRITEIYTKLQSNTISEYFNIMR